MPLWVRLLASAFCFTLGIIFFLNAKTGLQTGRIRYQSWWVSRNDDPIGFAMALIGIVCGTGIAMYVAYMALLPSSW